MRENANTRGVNDNWNESVKVMRLEVDQAKARALGVTSQSIAQASRTILAAPPWASTARGDKLIDIVLRQPLDERNAITDIGNAYLPTASGKSIPLSQIAKPVFSWEPGVMWRENRDYAITVQATSSKACRAPPSRRNCCPAARARGQMAGPGRATASRWRARWRRAARARRFHRRRADHAVHHLHAADAAAAQLQPLAAGVHHRPAGHRRRGGGAAAAEPALRLRGAAGRDRADGHDPAQLGDPDRPDRAGPRRAACRPGTRSSNRPCAGCGRSC
jgi:hypothetical protein